jgi:L-amino acid N-acyltransferase YncA
MVGRMTQGLHCRPAVPADLPAVAEIYAHYVANSVSTFETVPPDVLELAHRREEVIRHGLPYLVAELDGVVAGYAYATKYRPRPAYRFTVEDSIYIHPAHLRRGLGRLLLSGLICDAESAGYRQMVAVIGGSDNSGSIGLHEAFGFRRVGVLTAAGFKFGRWVDSVLMQRPLGEGDATPPGSWAADERR